MCKLLEAADLGSSTQEACATPTMAAQVRSKLWDDVVRERLEECDMPEDQKQDLRESTIDSAKKELEKVQNEHDNTNTSKVFKRLKPLIEIFEKFADFAAQLATLDPHGVASLVFGSLRLVVKVFCSPSGKKYAC